LPHDSVKLDAALAPFGDIGGGDVNFGQFLRSKAGTRIAESTRKADAGRLRRSE